MPLEDGSVPETQDAVTASFQIPGSRGVDGFIVLAAVELHHEPAGRAGEIDDVGADRILAAELVAHERAVAQVMPDLAPGIGNGARSEEQTSELQSIMRHSYGGCGLK